MSVSQVMEGQIERRPMTYAEYLTFASESQKMEWVNNEVLIYVSASTNHQDILFFLAWLVRAFANRFQLGKQLGDPFACRLWEGGPVREPDIAFISNDNLHKLDEQYCHGAPDLVVEIISKSSVRQDNVHKFQDYENAGVQEYWIIDPRRFYQTVELYYLNEDGVFEPVSPDDNGCLMSKVLPHFWLDPKWLWQTSFPDAEITFAEIMLTVPDLPTNLKAMYQMIVDTLSAE